MLLFLVLKQIREGLLEGQQKTRVPIRQIKDHRLKVLIHHLLESRDQEITVQDLMINPTIIIL